MARKQVVELKCDRCDRVEHRTVEGESTPLPASFKATMGDREVHFEDLCNPCWTTVKQHLDSISKKIEGMSPDRKKSKEKDLLGDISKKVDEAQKKLEKGLVSNNGSGAKEKTVDPSPPTTTAARR